LDPNTWFICDGCSYELKLLDRTTVERDGEICFNGFGSKTLFGKKTAGLLRLPLLTEGTSGKTLTPAFTGFRYSGGSRNPKSLVRGFTQDNPAGRGAGPRFSPDSIIPGLPFCYAVSPRC
ncbi:MAG: hypothetical protein ACLQPD_07415, partial [Desulfomonilaceae bacterium]